MAVHPRAPAFVFPSLGAYVGGDIVAGMLATGLTRDRRLRLFIDVGTNSEIALGSVDRVLATAAPAGPAFEAARSAAACGPPRRDRGRPDPRRRAHARRDRRRRPVGMCGSGLVDAVAELVQAGLLDRSGRFVPDEDAAERWPQLSDRLTKIGEERVFVLQLARADPAESVFLSQRDVRELQFAKASIATGWRILLNELGVEASEITQVLLAGSFGAYLTPLSAVRIGLVPKLALPRIVSAGNVAGEGAKIAALSLRERAEAHRSCARSSTSSYPAGRTSTTGSSTSWPSRDEAGAVVACGALAFDVRAIASAEAGRSTSCPSTRCCTTSRQIPRPRSRGCGMRDDVVALAYADCGTHGALDGAGLPGRPARTATTCSPRARGRRGCSPGGARDLFPHRLPGPHL